MLTPSKEKSGFDFCEEILPEEKKLAELIDTGAGLREAE